jgi:hypothetical protein
VLSGDPQPHAIGQAVLVEPVTQSREGFFAVVMKAPIHIGRIHLGEKSVLDFAL